MADQVKVIGLENLGSNINLLTNKVQRNIVRNATRAGARVYRDGMRQRAPKDSGELQKNIIEKDGPLRREGSYQALIGVKYTGKRAAKSRRPGKAPSSEDPAVYATFVELGRPGKGGHTHQAAQPFMRPTFDADSAKAEKAFADRAQQDLDKAL